MTEKKRHIGVLGGTFDPVHEGHLALARQARDRFFLDTVLFIPAPAPPHKQRKLTRFSHRLAMLEAVCSGESGFEISILETERTPPSYTVDTLAELHRRLDPCRLSLIIGADMFVEIESWHRFADLFVLADLIVAARPSVPVETVVRQVRALGDFSYDPSRNTWLRPDGFQIGWIEELALGVSSSEIRRLLARGEPVDHLVPGPVREYIFLHHLYRGQNHG